MEKYLVKTIKSKDLQMKSERRNLLETKLRKMVREELYYSSNSKFLKEGKLSQSQQKSIQKSVWKILESIRGSVDSSVYSAGESFLRALNNEFGSTAPM